MARAASGCVAVQAGRTHVLLLVVLVVAALLLASAAVLSARRAAMPYASATASVLGGQRVRLLLVGDHFSTVLKSATPALERAADGMIDIEIVGYDDMRRLTLANARDLVSTYDVVSFDVVWLGEYAAGRVLAALAPTVEQHAVLALDDVLPLALRQSRAEGVLYGLPIQPHPELLWYRTDLLAAAGIEPPRTTDQLLAAARKLTVRTREQYGLCWNGQRGQALGQQMAHLYAAFGQPLLDGSGRPALNTPRGLQAAQFAKALLAVSPPDILSTAWDNGPANSPAVRAQ